MVILLVVPLRVRFLQFVPRVRFPLKTGQKIAEDGITTLVAASGTRWLSQFARLFQSEETPPLHSPPIPARI